MIDGDSGQNTCNESGNDMGTSLLELVYGRKIDLEGLNENLTAKALEFKVEQERTKQQLYRFENIAKSIELLKLATEIGIPADQIASIFKDDSSGSAQQQQLHRLGERSRLSDGQNRAPMSYKFPPVGSNLPPKPMNFPPSNIKREQSSGKIGSSNAMAPLNTTKEIDPHVTPQKREDIDNDYDSSNDNSHQSHSSHSSNNEPENNINNASGNNKILRNFSVPGFKVSSTQAPTDRPIINLEGASQRSKQQELQRKTGMVGKKHRRTKSGSSFGVIDLNILEGSKQSKELPKSNQRQQPMNASWQPRMLSGVTRSPNSNSHDDKTCSENSSRNSSPMRSTRCANPVAKLLNSS